MIDMPPTLAAEVDARKSAEEAIVRMLRDMGHPIQVQDVGGKLSIDENTVRRAILRLAASGRAFVDADFNLSLAQAA